MNPKESGGTKNKARLFKITAVTGRTLPTHVFRHVYTFFLFFLFLTGHLKGLRRTLEHETMEYFS